MISESHVFVLNPYFRLKNMGRFVLLCGANDLGEWRLHSTFGVVLSLCDGSRTVADIAETVSPFTGIDDEMEARKTSLAIVKNFVRWMALSKEEQKNFSAKELGI